MSARLKRDPHKFLITASNISNVIGLLMNKIHKYVEHFGVKCKRIGEILIKFQ